MAGVIANTLKYQGLNLAVASGHTIKVAFYSDAKDATFAAYSATSEVTQAGATPALNAGGLTLSNRTITASDGSVATAAIDFDNPTLTPSGSNIQFRSIVVYNDSQTPKYALYVEDFGSTQTWNAGTTYTLNLGSGSTLLRFG
jgi:hypothetical protein